jgi:NTE family protein
LSQTKIKAYAILSGGGVKGAALAGALDAAEEIGFEFIGYGGCSAGSLVALLASLGYSNRELKDLVVGTDFAEFLDDRGQMLRALLVLLKQTATPLGLCKAVYKILRWRLWSRVHSHYGLYSGERLSAFVERKIREKVTALDDLHAVTFRHLRERGCKPLKVIASDIRGRKPIIYSSSHVDDQVSHAIRASVGFPIVFRPVKHLGRYLVDGGLSSNLPVALFDDEHSWGGVPVIAFDLQTSGRAETDSIRNYCSDLVATALEAGDVYYRVFHNIHYIPVKLSEDIKDIETLNFFLTSTERQQLWETGRRRSLDTLDKAFRSLKQARGPVQGYQAALNLPPAYLESLLGALAVEVTACTPARDIHAYLFLRDERESLVLVHYRDGRGSSAPAVRLDSEEAWPMCVAFRSKQPQAADLARWLATAAPLQQEFAAFLTGRQASFSVPIFEQAEKAALAQSVKPIPVIGVVMLDSETPLDVAQWLVRGTREPLLEAVNRWAGILARILR